VISEV